MMLLRNLRGSTPLGLWLSPHRADTKRLDRQPSHLRATCDVPVAEPTTAHRVVCQPRRSRQHIACIHAPDKAARTQFLHKVLGRQVFNSWNQLISLK
jgi:hypothetical protein